MQNESFDDVINTGFPGGETLPAIFQPPPPAVMEQAAESFDRPGGATVDDVAPNPGNKPPLPGIGGGPGMYFATVPVTLDGQTWYVVKDTPEDKANAEKWRAYLKSRERSQLEWLGDTVGDGLNFVKNVAAGVVNTVVPGSDLGDAGDPGQIVGALVGTFANPAGAVLGSISKGVMGLGALGNAISSTVNLIGKANQFLTSPLGQIGSTVVGSLVSGAIQPASNIAYPGAVRTSPLVPDATMYPGWQPRINTGWRLQGGALQQQSLLPIKVQTPMGTVDTTKQSPVNNMWLIAAAAAAVLFFLMRKK